MSILCGGSLDVQFFSNNPQTKSTFFIKNVGLMRIQV